MAGCRLRSAISRLQRSPAPMGCSWCLERPRGLRRGRLAMPTYCGMNNETCMTKTPSPNRDSSDQEQYLTILSREEAMTRFDAALFPRATASEQRPLSKALGLPLAQDVMASIDVPP